MRRPALPFAAVVAAALAGPLTPGASATPCPLDAACVVVATACGVLADVPRHLPVCDLP
ncbi:MAG TPA: hypothetical protein VGX28_17040 [Frankiaceae bacterium]|nr:hypothetical protein [Frankiaceae bacterium]